MTDAGEKLRERAIASVLHASCSCAEDHLERFARAELERAAGIAERDGNSCKQYGCGTIIAAAIRKLKE